MSGGDTIQVYKGKGRIQPWRYRVISSNGQNVGNPGEGYFSAWNAKRAALKRNPGAKVVRVEE